MQRRHARFFGLAITASAIVVGIVLARGASLLQSYWSPVVAFPILFGAVAGLVVVQLAARCWPQLPRAILISAAIAAGITLAVGQHCFDYRHYLNNFQRALVKHPEAELVGLRPRDFAEFLQISARQRTYGPWELHGQAVWLSWILDGLLTVAAGAAVACWRPWGSPSAPPIKGPIQ